MPEIHDGFQWKLFLCKSSTVRDVIDAVVEELGLTKALPIPGGGTLEYVLEEVWSDDHVESELHSYASCTLPSLARNTDIAMHCVENSRIPLETPLSTVLENPLLPNPIGPSANRSFRFCVPDEWYRRSKSRNVSTTSSDVSQDTIRRLADLEEYDEDDDVEGEGTAKQKDLEHSDVARSGGFKAPMDWRGSISQNRFSSILDNWMRPQSPTGEATSPPPEKKVVSEPKLVEHKTGDTVSSDASNEQSAAVDMTEFEQMLVSLMSFPLYWRLIKRRMTWALKGLNEKPCTASLQSRSAICLSRTMRLAPLRSPGHQWPGRIVPQRQLQRMVHRALQRYFPAWFLSSLATPVS